MTPRRIERSNGPEERLAAGLGWFSIGLGLSELMAPGATARLIGVRNGRSNRAVMRAYGVREIAAGIGILSQPRPAGWVWGRVAGDILDIGSLGAAMISSGNRLRVTAALGAVLGVTALDLYCGEMLNRLPENTQAAKPSGPSPAMITIDRPPDELYRSWRGFQESRARDGVSRIFTSNMDISENPDQRRITWRAKAGSGALRFEPAPAGRGTVVRAELDAPSGTVARVAGKVFGMVASELMRNELRAFKQLVETGEIAASDASIHPGMHEAQPPRELAHA